MLNIIHGLWWVSMLVYAAFYEVAQQSLQLVRESWDMATRVWSKVKRRRTRKQQVHAILDERISKLVEKLVDDRIIKRGEANAFYERMADAGFHNLGNEPNPDIDGLAYGKPFYKRLKPPKPIYLKNMILGRFRQTSIALGKVWPAMNDAQIYSQLQKIKEMRAQEQKSKRRKLPTAVYRTAA